jgi:hypothetical protein
MKALTLTQPWATLVAIGAKRIETRSWSTSYRGPLAIHAAKGFPWDARDFTYAKMVRDLVGPHFNSSESGPLDKQLPRGSVIATCNLVACWETKWFYLNGLVSREDHSCPETRIVTVEMTEQDSGRRCRLSGGDTSKRRSVAVGVEAVRPDLDYGDIFRKPAGSGIFFREYSGTCVFLVDGEKCGIAFTGAKNRKYCDRHSFHMSETGGRARKK